ncbi:MAG TPA: tyrosine-type recombinase/integrase [Urbifossiella sp.]|nr:tyrosine-type recombinase/integrase [Urbifossiella sp.]
MIQYFTAEIRNPNTRAAYARAVARFDRWCQEHGFRLEELTPIHVGAYVEALGREVSKPTVKQHLAALRMLCDYLVIGQVMAFNPATSVRGPKYVVKKGKPPVLGRDEARALLDGIPADTVGGLRDRALIALMVYTFSRVGAAVAMNVEDYAQQGKRWWVRLHEKGGKEHAVPCHHKLDEYLDAYLKAGGIEEDRRGPLFRRLDRLRRLSADRLTRREALTMVKRRAAAAGLGSRVCNHSFRATGITAYLEGGGSLEHAQQIAAHESPRTTKLYDRTSDEVTVEEIERIRL